MIAYPFPLATIHCCFTSYLLSTLNTSSSWTQIQNHHCSTLPQETISMAEAAQPLSFIVRELGDDDARTSSNLAYVSSVNIGLFRCKNLRSSNFFRMKILSHNGTVVLHLEYPFVMGLIVFFKVVWSFNNMPLLSLGYFILTVSRRLFFILPFVWRIRLVGFWLVNVNSYWYYHGIIRVIIVSS